MHQGILTTGREILLMFFSQYSVELDYFKNKEINKKQHIQT